MKSMPSRTYILTGLAAMTLGFAGVLFTIMGTGETKEHFTKGPGYQLLEKDTGSVSGSGTRTGEAPVAVGSVTIDQISYPVTVLGKAARKIDFSRINCVKEIRRPFIEVSELGHYPLDAHLVNLSKDLRQVVDFGSQWGRPVPDTVLELFRSFIPDFKGWVAAPTSQKSEIPDGMAFGTFTVLFGHLVPNTFLFYLPFKNGGSLGPVEYTGVREPALIIGHDQKQWILPYRCGNGPAEVILPCDDGKRVAMIPARETAHPRKVLSTPASGAAISHPLPTAPDSGTSADYTDGGSTTPAIWIPDNNGGGGGKTVPDGDTPGGETPGEIPPDGEPPDDKPPKPSPEWPHDPVPIIKPDPGSTPAVPEPATWLTMLMGLAFLYLMGRRRK